MEKIRSYKTWLMGFSITFLATATLVLVFYEVALAIIDGSVNDLFWLKTYIGTVVVIVLFALSFIIDRILGIDVDYSVTEENVTLEDRFEVEALRRFKSGEISEDVFLKILKSNGNNI